MPIRDERSRLEIRLFGAPEILVDGSPLHVDTRKAVAILVVLATDGRPYARDELAALLWPDSDDAAARGALRRTLSVMRAAMGVELLTVDRARVEIVTGRGDDRPGRSSNGWPARRRSMTWPPRPTSLEGRSWPASACVTARTSTTGARPARWRSSGRVLGVLDRLAGAAEAAGDLPAAIEAAARRLDLDPLDEGAHVRLMELYTATGDPAAAVRQYRACVAVLDVSSASRRWRPRPLGTKRSATCRR